MSNTDSKDMDKASEAIADMIGRSKTAQAAFQEGTSQYTLQKNRIQALEIARAFIEREAGRSDLVPFEKSELKTAVAPIRSLISKSEKAKGKLKPDTWQYKMLESNIAALTIALPLIVRAIDE